MDFYFYIRGGDGFADPTSGFMAIPVFALFPLTCSLFNVNSSTGDSVYDVAKCKRNNSL